MEARWEGALVVFRHRSRPYDEMRSWAQDADLSAEDALGLALEPALRVWRDGWGRRWDVSWQRIPSSFRGNGTGATGGEGELLFKSGVNKYFVPVVNARHLGHYSAEEFTVLLREYEEGD